MADSLTLHGKSYKIPRRPTVVVCIDGFDPTYLEQGIADGILPTLASFVERGFSVTADAAMPSFTNPNNVSIITGAPTAAHGIAGNYFLDPETGRETMIVDDTHLRGTTILAELAARGVRVGAITAKDKLRRLISHGLDSASEAAANSRDSNMANSNINLCFSAECADDKTLKWMGRASRPSQYSGDLSLFVLDAGVQIMRERHADLLYLTLSDFVQHKHAPGTPAANEFMSAVDSRIGALIGLGAIVAVTGDHGMSDKSNADGEPNILFLQDLLEAQFGVGCARVICPITDPFVKHHGALGSFVRVHVRSADAKSIPDMIEHCRALPQVEVTLPRVEAAKLFETPEDLEGVFAVVSKKDFVIGSKADEHDLGSLEGHRLRSHGGLSELRVPLLMSKAITQDEETLTRRWRNFNIFDLILNYGQ